MSRTAGLGSLRVPASRWSPRLPEGGVFWLAQVGSGLLLAVVVAPLLALAFTLNPADFAHGIASPSVHSALLLSAETTAVCLAITVITGTPLAWHLARTNNWGTRVAEVVLQLPIVVPPAVAGVGLLMAFGRQGMFGPTLAVVGIRLPFTTWAVLIAQIFVSAPLYVRTATAAFKTVDEDTLRVARTLGGSPSKVFLRIAVPAALPGLVAGAALSWARALGEFGATLMVGGSLPGHTETLPIVLYNAVQAGQDHTALIAALWLTGTALVLVWLVNRLERY